MVIGVLIQAYGTYAPAPVLTDALRDEAMKTILEPMVAAMAKEGMPYVGCLYAGLMITNEGPKVVEFNARFGDPEHKWYYHC